MKLWQRIENISPLQDYPTGLIHPYWARKPLNIVEEIIKTFTSENDIVFDPFMGSGTSLVAALKLKRRVIGSDLNPLAVLIVQVLLDCSSSERQDLRKLLIDACEAFSEYALNLYRVDCDAQIAVERETYEVIGDYNNGAFILAPQIFKTKPFKNGYLKGSTVNIPNIKYAQGLEPDLESSPIDFSKISFVENTRIAVHKGVVASHFFTPRNRQFINFALRYLGSIKEDISVRVIQLFISSMLPMLRLSDKKASSQWPYWRPKDTLTSRNPVVAIEKRKKAFLDMFDWVNENIDPSYCLGLFHSAAQDVSNKIHQQVDLVVTDPPYADHAPYLEYSELFWSIVSSQSVRTLWESEVVKTNAVGRSADSLNYEIRLKETYSSFLSTLKVDGYFVFFYLDKNLEHWMAIKQALHAASCMVHEVIPVKKQRRSMKAVTTPGKTLDGDLIIVCRKVHDIPPIKAITLNEAILAVSHMDSYFSKFAKFISIFLQNDIINLDDLNVKDISRIF